MSATDNNPLHAAINATLGQIAAAAPARPSWYEAWQRLGPATTDEERLTVYQAIRSAGSVPEDAGFYLVSWQIDAITLRCAAESFHDLEERQELIQLNLRPSKDESWRSEARSEYEDAQRQVHDAWDALYATKLEAFGETAMAHLYRTDRARFEQRSEAGRLFFHGAEAVEEEAAMTWLNDLLDAVAACLEPDSPMGPLGMRSHEDADFWEVFIYPTPVELVGGAHDGAVVAPGFSLDLEQLRAAFASISAFGWSALGLNAAESPYISLEGVFQGREVALQVLAQAPEDEEPGAKIDTTK